MMISLSPRNKAIQYLAMREHSYLEISRKLLQKGYENNEIECALAKLVDDGLLSDARFGEAFVRYRIQKGQGPMRIRAELKEKGLGGSQIDSSFEAVEIDWAEVILKVWNKKYADSISHISPSSLNIDAADKARQWRFLQYRGFTSSQINTLFK